MLRRTRGLGTLKLGPGPPSWAPLHLQPGTWHGFGGRWEGHLWLDGGCNAVHVCCAYISTRDQLFTKALPHGMGGSLQRFLSNARFYLCKVHAAKA